MAGERNTKPISVSLFGQFSVIFQGQPVQLPTQPTRSLLANLVTHGSRSQSRYSVALEIWPDVDEEKALNRLRTTLVAIRSAFADVEALVGDRHEIGINVDLFSSDVSEAKRLYQQARVAQEPGQELAMLRELDQFYSRGFLLGWRDPWVEAQRIHWIQRDREVKLRLSQAALGLHDYDLALDAVERLLGVDPYDEEGWTLYFRLMTALHKSAEALDRFRLVRNEFLEHSHVDFSPELMALAKRIRDNKISSETALPARIPQAERDLVIGVIEKQLDDDPHNVLALCTSQAFKLESAHSPYDALGLLNKAIERTDPSDKLRLSAQDWAARLAMLVGDHATVFDYCEEIVEQTDPSEAVHRAATNHLGFANFELRNWDAAETYLNTFKAMVDEFGTPSEQAVANMQLGSVAWHLLRLEESDHRYAEGIAYLKDSPVEQDQRTYTVAIGNMAFVATIRRDWDKAKELCDLAMRRSVTERTLVVTSAMRAVRSMLYALDGDRMKARELGGDSFAATFRNRLFRMHQVSADYIGTSMGLLGMRSEGASVLEAYTGFRARDNHERSPAEEYFLEFARESCGNSEPIADWVTEARPAKVVSTVCHKLETG